MSCRRTFVSLTVLLIGCLFLSQAVPQTQAITWKSLKRFFGAQIITVSNPGILLNGVVYFNQYSASGGGYNETYYMTPNTGNDSSYSGDSVRSSSVVYCPSGASVSCTNQGQCQCFSGGAAVNPLPGHSTGRLPEYVTPGTTLGGSKLYKVGTSNADYYRTEGGQWRSCPNGIAGPYVDGVSQNNPSGSVYTYTSDYQRNTHYYCKSADGSRFEEGTTLSSGPTGNFGYSAYVCPSGDSSCAAPDTYATGFTSCSRGTTICQTTDPNTRYCSADQSCSGSEFTPPAPAWTLNPPTNIRLVNNGGKNSFETSSSITFGADFTITGIPPQSSSTSLYYKVARVKVSTSPADFTNPLWTTESLSTSTNLTVTANAPSYSFPVGGPYYFCLQMGMKSANTLLTSFDQADQMTTCVASPTSFGMIAPVQTPASATTTIGTCTGFTMSFTGNKISYVNGDMVNYTYKCASGTGTVAIKLFKPDLTSVEYNSGTASSTTMGLGFSTSNLSAGNYTLKACFESACTASSTISLPFTLASSASDTTTTTTTTTSSMCQKNTWKEIQWNTLTPPLKSCVRVDVPQSVIDAAKEACKNASSSSGQVTWPNGGDDSIPATFGVPSCNGFLAQPEPTVCPQVISPMSCPAGKVLRSSGTAACPYSTCEDANSIPPITSTVPGQCKAGEKCLTTSWCSMGKQCYYPDGNMTCTTNWAETCPSGTKLCSPNDTKCIEPGATGPIDGWCRDAMECYTADGAKKFCNPMEYQNMSGTSGAADMSTLPMKQMSCPAGYKMCRPGDNNCIELGQKGPSTGWCASGGKQCYLPDGQLQCVSWSESCPSDAKVCRSEDKNCVEPDSYGSKDAWCGGQAVQCHKKDGTGVYCASVKNTHDDPTAWEKTQCPSETSRCRSDDKYCLEFGQSGPVGSWCAAGMKKDNSDGTISCVSWNDLKNLPVPVKPEEPKACIQVISLAYHPETYACKSFATPCNVPVGWIEVKDGRVCRDGKLLDVDTAVGQDDQSLMKLLDENARYLEDINLQLKRVPSSVIEVRQVIAAVQDAQKILKSLYQLFPPKTEAQRKVIQEKLSVFLKDVKPNVDEKMAALRSYIDYATVKRDIERELFQAKSELEYTDPASGYHTELKAAIERLDSLMKSASTQSGKGLEQVLVALSEARTQLIILIDSQREGSADDLLERTLEGLQTSFDSFQDYLEEKEITDSRILAMMDRFEVVLDKLDTSSSRDSLSRLVDEGVWIRDRIASWLSGHGLEKKEKLNVDEIFAHLEAKVLARVDEMVSKLSNKLQALVDTKIQQALVTVAELTEKLKGFDARVTQSISNLTSVSGDQREALIQSKTDILNQVENLNTALDASNVSTFTAQKLRELMTVASSINWCGEVAESVQSWIGRTGLALESDSLSADQSTLFEKEINGLQTKNDEECYRIKAASFRDVPMNEWYFSAAEFNKQNGFVKGYADASGTSTGQFGPGDPTLRIEALAMAMRMYGISPDVSTTLNVAAEGVPEWGNVYVNGAVKAGFTIDSSKPFDQPITRLESAELFANLGKKYITVSSSVDSAAKYTDYDQFKGNVEGALAVDALSAIEVLRGSNGAFRPNDTLVRSEFATINQRLVEELGLSASSQ